MLSPCTGRWGWEILCQELGSPQDLAKHLTALELTDLPSDIVNQNFVALCCLTRLTSLSLRTWNGVFTDALDIAPEITALRKLQHLCIGDDVLVSCEISQLPQLTNIEVHCPPRTLLQALVGVTSLAALTLTQEELNFPASLHSLKGLQSLHLVDVGICNDACAIHALTSLTSLEITDAWLDNNLVASQLLAVVSCLRQLQVLVFKQNRNDRISCHCDIDLLTGLSRLRVLELEHLKLDPPLEQLPSGLWSLLTLRIDALAGLLHVPSACQQSGLLQLTELHLKSHEGHFQIKHSLISLCHSLPKLSKLCLIWPENDMPAQSRQHLSDLQCAVGQLKSFCITSNGVEMQLI